MTTSPPLSPTAQKMLAVSTALNQAPEGPKKTEACRHLIAARRALAARHDGECNRELDSATYALA